MHSEILMQWVLIFAHYKFTHFTHLRISQNGINAAIWSGDRPNLHTLSWLHSIRFTHLISIWHKDRLQENGHNEYNGESSIQEDPETGRFRQQKILNTGSPLYGKIKIFKILRKCNTVYIIPSEKEIKCWTTYVW